MNNLYPINFNQGFIPERKYLSKLLKYAKEKKNASKSGIANVTGIPTGNSSGKVEPHIKYATAMGLMQSNYSKKNWELENTDFGNILLSEDPYLGEKMTQWLLHYMLSNPINGSLLWHTVFYDIRTILGEKITKNIFDDYIQRKVPSYSQRNAGPLFNMYKESASFAEIKPINSKEKIEYNQAPFRNEFFKGYAGLFFIMWDTVFANERQILLQDFLNKTKLFHIYSWDKKQIYTFFDSLNNWGYLRLDKQAGATLITRNKITKDVLQQMFDDLI